jgi:outer membrane immunogenic protein
VAGFQTHSTLKHDFTKAAHEQLRYQTRKRKKELSMKLRNTILATLAIAAFPTMAFAEPFNGPYVGAQICWDKHDTIGDGLSYGVLGGYNAKVGEKAVIGLEGTVGFSSATKNVTSTVGTTTFTAKADIGRELGIAARAGFLAGPNTLFYVKGGYENIRAKVTTSGNIPGFANLTALAGNVDAVVAGGGVEHALNETTSFRINYDYANGKGGYDRHRVLAGVAFHF